MASASKGIGGFLVLLLSVQAIGDPIKNPTLGKEQDPTKYEKESTITIHPTPNGEELRVTVEGVDLTHELRLHLSEGFVTEDFVVGLVNEDGSITPQKHQPARCHYDGGVVGAEGSRAAISTCNGFLEGFYDIGGIRSTLHAVEFLPGASVRADVRRANIATTAIRLAKQHHGITTANKLTSSTETSAVGAIDRRELQEHCGVTTSVTPCCYNRPNTCGSCSMNTDVKILEVSFITDAYWHQSYGASNDRAMSVFHMAAALYEAASFNPKIILQLKAWIPFNTTTPSSVMPPAVTCNCQGCVNGNSFVDDEIYLNRIGDYRSTLSDSLKGDTTQFLTGHDLAYPTGGEVCPDPTGIANMGQICDSSASIGVNEDLFGETAVYAAETVAHEIGHVLGAF